MIERNKSLDIAKAIGIILVVIGHSNSPLESFVYLFHMPLFFFISGYFYKEEYSDNIGKLILKRLKTLYLPFVTYQTIFLLLHNVFYNINIYSSNLALGNQAVNYYNLSDFIKGFLRTFIFVRNEPLAGAFWFFTTLFMINIMFCLISIIVKHIINKEEKRELFRFIIVLIFFGVGSLCEYYKIHLPVKTEVAFVVLLFFYSGLLYKKYESNIKIKFSISSVFFITLIISSFYGTLSISTNENVNPIFLLCNSFMGIYLILYISKYLSNLNIELRLLEYIGNNTIPILCLHFLSFKIVSLIQVLIYKYPNYKLASFPVISGENGWWILYALIGVFIPICIQHIISILKNINNVRIRQSDVI